MAFRVGISEIVSKHSFSDYRSRTARACAAWLMAAVHLASLHAQDHALETQHKYTNALIQSTSPYLLQHAHNPVNWMPWGPEAFAKAKAENKPIFVSIGYSTCYWCHVMERESFENEKVAKVLNDNYVAIKVDREERPDIDEQLMLATQLLTGRGGWPNSIWLTVDGRPWMAGTYFPRDNFIGALQQLAGVWKNQPEAVNKQADSLSDAIRTASRHDVPDRPLAIDAKPMQRLMEELTQVFDPIHGGFGTKPKFPPHGQLRLLALATGTGDEAAKNMLTRTLDGIWCGGIHDHVGGGFHRYSTDERWFLPHFEKMLYDNAQLMRAFAEAYAVAPQPHYTAAADDIFQWLQREMTHSRGAFYSAIDSESEGGEEGRYYTWSASELSQALSAEDAKQFSATYHFAPEGNFAEEATGERPGTNIPFLTPSQTSLYADSRFESMRAKLREQRSLRDYPHLDDKILTSWNGLMISALARAGVTFKQPQYIDAAAKAAEFVLEELQDQGALLRTWRNDTAALPGYLDDYAYFIEGLVELHAATGDARWQTEAVRLTDQMLALFEDRQHGGFYFTSESHEKLLLRSKNLMGGGNLPDANGVAIQVLLKLAAISSSAKQASPFGERYLAAAKRGLGSFSELMRKSPRQVEHLVLAGEMYRAQFSGRDEPQSAGTQTANTPSYSDDAITAHVFLQHIVAKPGQEFLVAIEILVSPGYHLYGKSENNVVQRTTVTLADSAVLDAGRATEPSGSPKDDPVLGEKIVTLEGKLMFFLPIQVSPNAKEGDVELTINLTYQACTTQHCLRPQTVALTKQIRISDTASEQLRFNEKFETKP